MNERLRAVCDMSVATVRENAGLHQYDGVVQDMSPAGVRAGLARIGGPALDDPHDDAHLAAFEDAARAFFGELEMHRRDPMCHLFNLDVTCYERAYAPPEELAAARRRQLAAWPDGIQAAIESLDAVTAPVARAVLPPLRGLAAGLDPDDPIERAALAAHQRLCAHVQVAADTGDPRATLGGAGLARLMGAQEAITVDLGRLATLADAERDRLRAMLSEACKQYDPSRTPADILAELMTDHPDPDGVLDRARHISAEVIAFTRARRLAPYLDGECLVGPSPASRRWALASLSWAGPEEPDAPAWYYVTPPDPGWSPEEAEGWLTAFSTALLLPMTVHEVAPGHFAHGRAMRHAPTPVRRVLQSDAFIEGWAHYMEEVCLEEGFRPGDPRYGIGLAVGALQRVTRLAVAIGLHTGAMDVAEGTARFVADAYLAEPTAASEARRGTFDPTYGRYTWGKLVIRELRGTAMTRWGADYSPERFHRALMDLGSPPLGLLATALERG
jgi:hypothetical protein